MILPLINAISELLFKRNVITLCTDPKIAILKMIHHWFYMAAAAAAVCSTWADAQRAMESSMIPLENSFMSVIHEKLEISKSYLWAPLNNWMKNRFDHIY